MTFSYLTYWLYATFYNSKIIFGIALATAGYFAITYSGATTALVVVFAILFVLGPQLQNTIWFGLGPLLQPFGIDLQGGSVNAKISQLEQTRQMEKIEQKISAGAATQEEIEMYQQSQVNNMQGQEDDVDNMANYDAMRRKSAIALRRR